MNKLTLSAEPTTINKAKQLAAEQGISVSALFSRFVINMSSQSQSTNDLPLGPLTQQAIGVVSLDPDKSDRQLIEEALSERYEH